MQLFYRLSLLTLLFLLSPIINAQTDAQSAGQVIITSGPFQAQTFEGKSRDLLRGTYFYSGETLITGTNSTAQVKFSDGTVMAFYPNTRVKVDEYVYKKDPKTDKSVVTLVQGGFRALTGLISKANPAAYKAQTPVAVIGLAPQQGLGGAIEAILNGIDGTFQRLHGAFPPQAGSHFDFVFGDYARISFLSFFDHVPMSPAGAPNVAPDLFPACSGASHLGVTKAVTIRADTDSQVVRPML